MMVAEGLFYLVGYRLETTMANEHFKKIKKEEIHVTGGENGCLWRSCGRTGHKYRTNGKDYIEANKAKLGRYYNHDFTRSGSAAKSRADAVLGTGYYGNSQNKDPRHTKDLWHIGKHGNFGSGTKPWKNNAHHILPCAVLRDAFTTGNEYELMLQGKYNLNAGENVIWLPKKELDGQIMQMVTHPGSHPAYNDNVESLVHTKIKPKIKKAADPESDGHGPLEEADVPKIRDTINSETENIMMNTLKYGKIGAGITVNLFDPGWTQQ
jgi:hypothetical protein